MVRYKIQFTVTAEQLFKHVAQFIPVENLHIEEMIDLPPPQPMPIPKRPSPPIKTRKYRVKSVRRLNTSHGMNVIVMRALADGMPTKTAFLEKAIIKEGYSKSSIHSQLKRMSKHGLIIRESLGYWRKNSAYQIPEETDRVEDGASSSDSGAENPPKVD